jgi:alkylation response protein AidB-like acyl-CoA dehydrogenase
MDPRYPEDVERFRATVRQWLFDELPDGWFEGRRPGRDDWHTFCEEWNAMLHRTGWSCCTWPTEYGGRGLSPLESVVLVEELARAGVPVQRASGGEILVGPTILHWGTDSQKQRFLPPIVRGEEIWCQGFSEPGSGSDLASLQTRAVRDGDDWVIDGTKIWTSEAPHADMVFLLARTDPDASAHRGISYLLVPMHQPGVEVLPIAQIDGTAGFAEVHFNGARCPAANVLGGEGNGWMVANSTLGFERGVSATTSYRRFEEEIMQIVEAARRNGRIADPGVRQRLARVWSDAQIMRFNSYRMVAGLVHPEMQASLAGLQATTKVHWTELHQRLTDLGLDVLGAQGQVLTGISGAPPVVGVGMGARPAVYDYPASAAQSTFLFARSGTIFGGTSEIQRNVIAERVLGLPREPRPTAG